MAQWQVSLVDGLMDFSFSILIALFYASVLSARYGKTKFRVNDYSYYNYRSSAHTANN